MIHTIYLAADQGGFHLKENIKKHLKTQKGYDIIDLGVDTERSVDYPGYAKKLADHVVGNDESVGILFCGSGTGVCIGANKTQGIRAAMCNSSELAQLAREHNGANVLCLGGRTQNFNEPLDIVETFLNTPYDSADRHKRRRDQLDAL